MIGLPVRVCVTQFVTHLTPNTKAEPERVGTALWWLKDLGISGLVELLAPFQSGTVCKTNVPIYSEKIHIDIVVPCGVSDLDRLRETATFD